MFAAIDIGSNTVQMLICRAENGLLCDRRNYIATTRLGGGDADGHSPATLSSVPPLR